MMMLNMYRSTWVALYTVPIFVLKIWKIYNLDATENLAKICSKHGIFFIYISTDYVFDGKNPPYQIGDKTNPLNKYGLSKLNGERVTINDSKGNNFTINTL